VQTDMDGDRPKPENYRIRLLPVERAAAALSVTYAVCSVSKTE